MERTQAGTEVGWCTVLCSGNSLVAQNHCLGMVQPTVGFPISISYEYVCICSPANMIK